MTLDRTFFYGILLFTAGIFLSQKVLVPFWLIPAGGVAGALLVLTGARGSQRRWGQGGWLLFFLAAGLLLAVDADKPPPDSVFHLIGRRGVLTGSVLPGSWRTVGEDRVAFVIQAAAFSTPEETVAAGGRVRVYLRQVPAGAKIPAGSIVSVGGEIRPLTGLSNPGGQDAARWAARQDIYASLSARYTDVVDGGRRRYDIAVYGGLLTEDFADKISRVLPPTDRALIMSMLFGGYGGLTSGVIEDFSAAGLVHILSVSGTHVVLLTGFLAWLLARCRIRGKTAAAVTIAFIWFYACLAGLAVPVLRAAGAATLMLLGRLFDRQADNGRILGGVLILSLSYEPRWLFSVSWQLSFLTAGGLIYLYPRLKQYLSFLPEYIAAAIAAPIAAQLAVLPLLAGYFYQLSLVSLPANILILPLLECCLMLAMLGLPCLYILPPAGSLLFILSGLGLGLGVRLIELLAALPWAVRALPALPDWLWLCYYVLLTTAFGWWPVNMSARGRGILSAGIAAVAIIAFCWPSNRDGRLMVHFLDVGQGDAAVIITPRRQAVLIDTGGRYGGFDAGGQIILPYLKHYGLREIELLILSHGHNDHAGGAAAVAGRLPVREIWLPARDAGLDTERLRQTAPPGRFTAVRAGMVREIDGIRIEVIFTPDSLYTAQKRNRENSAAVKLSYQGHSFLFTGDLNAAEEREIVSATGKVSVLKVAHHGSAAASDPLFLQAVQPELAVISVGRRNRYGHPAGETLDRLARQGCVIARTDEQGAVLAEVWRGKLYWHGYRHNPAAF